MRTLERFILWSLVFAVIVIYVQIGWVILGKKPEQKTGYKENRI